MNGNEPEPRRAALPSVAWQVVDVHGAPISIAVVTSEGKTWPCDTDGRGSMAIEAMHEVAAVVEAQGFASWRGLLRPGLENKVQLAEGGVLEVVALNEALAPLKEVVVWLSPRPTAEAAMESDPALPRAVTGSDGVARLRAAHGEYYLQARHPVYVNSTQRLKQMGLYADCFRVRVGAVTSSSVVHMAMPYVVGVSVVDGEVAYQSFRGRDSGLHRPSNPDGAAACDRIRTELESRFAGASFLVQLRDMESARYGKGYPTIHAHLMIVGYKPKAVQLEPVAMVDFEGPTRISSVHLEPSDQWGGVVLRLRPPRGRPVQGLRLAIAASGDWARSDQPKIAHKILEPDRIVTLPVGTYDIAGEGYFEASMPGLHRRGLVVAAGSLQEIVLDCDFEFSLVRLELMRDVGMEPLLGGAIELQHEPTGVRVQILVNRFDEPPQLWIPVGNVRMTVQAQAESMPDHLWRLEDEPLTIGGGSDAAPQVVRKSLTLVKVR